MQLLMERYALYERQYQIDKNQLINFWESPKMRINWIQVWIALPLDYTLWYEFSNNFDAKVIWAKFLSKKAGLLQFILSI